MVTFALVGLSPIDPVQMNLGQASYARMGAAQRAQLASYWGTDLPVWQRYLNWAGSWWLAVFPGLALLLVVLAFDRLGTLLRRLVDARSVQE